MVRLGSDKVRVGIVLVLLSTGFLMVSLGSYLALTYTQGAEVMLAPHPPYCTEKTVTGTLTPENPSFTLNTTYFAFGFEGNPISGITPTLTGRFEANDTVDFYINDSNKPHENPIFRVNGTKSSNFTVTFSTWAGVYSGVWSLNLQNNSETPVNFTLSYYKEIVGDINLMTGQEGITSAIYFRVFKDSFSVHAFHESSWLYAGVGGGFLLVSSSRGGLWNHQILRNAYILMLLGGVIIAVGAGIEVLRRREG